MEIGWPLATASTRLRIECCAAIACVDMAAWALPSADVADSAGFAAAARPLRAEVAVTTFLESIEIPRVATSEPIVIRPYAVATIAAIGARPPLASMLRY